MNELIATSYHYLGKYFGTDVDQGDYPPFLPKDIPSSEAKEPESPDGIPQERQERPIEGTQAPGSNILFDKKGDSVASMTLTELMTPYSNFNNESIGLVLSEVKSEE